MIRFSLIFIFLFLGLESYSQILPGMFGSVVKKGSGGGGGAASGTRNFTNCGKAGSEGPSQSDCNTAYASNDLNGEVTVTSGIQYWTTPTTGTYTITAIGATAGNDGYTSAYVGRPAKIIGDFSLTQGDVIKILVGQHGWKASCRPGWGGGGGTFVTKNDNTILLIAGGCGSSHTNISNVNTWQDANTGESGNFQSGDTHAAGTNGSGGGGTNNGGSGAGYSGDGNTGNSATYQLCSGVPTQHTTPKSFLNGGVGDVIGGGFGGGAGVMNTWGGGGGGYSGGGGSLSSPYAGAGGGSKNNGSNQTNTLNDIGTNKAELDGSVVITW